MFATPISGFEQSIHRLRMLKEIPRRTNRDLFILSIMPRCLRKTPSCRCRCSHILALILAHVSAVDSDWRGIS